MKIGEPVDTRWYTHFNCVDGLLKAWNALSILVSSGDPDRLHSVYVMKFTNTLIAYFGKIYFELELFFKCHQTSLETGIQ